MDVEAEITMLKDLVIDLHHQVEEARDRSEEIIEELHRIWTADPEAGAGEPKP